MEDGELLPLACEDAQLWLYNAFSVADGLDEERSEIERFRSGRILKLGKAVFLPQARPQFNAFKIRGLEDGPLFVSDRVAALAQTAGLRGTVFRE
jgi:hypothetical protein